MQRCPACDARLNDSSLCSRCGADLSRILRCEHLAEQWLSLSLQSLQAGRPDIAAAAIRRSLSFKQTPEAKLVKSFLIEHQYRALYQSLGLRRLHEAGDILSGLRSLQGENEALRRFDELHGCLSSQADSSTRYD